MTHLVRMQMPNHVNQLSRKKPAHILSHLPHQLTNFKKPPTLHILHQNILIPILYQFDYISVPGHILENSNFIVTSKVTLMYLYCVTLLSSN